MEKRLQAVLAGAGLCSRRRAEEWIIAGRVRVNGQPARLGMRVDPDKDRVEVDGKPVAAVKEPILTVILHKPPGFVTTLSDEKGRKTVASLVSGTGRRLFPVGRLDYQSSGLLLMTNDGSLAYALTHPRHEVDKEYHAEVQGPVKERLHCLASGPVIDGYQTRPADVALLGLTEKGGNLKIVIREGRNRQVRKMCALCGLRVLSLKRVRIGELHLGGLPAGKWRLLTEKEREYVAGLMSACGEL